MRIGLFYLLIAVLVAGVLANDAYNRSGLKLAKDECRREGLLKIYDRDLWRSLKNDAELAKRATRAARHYRPDKRLSRTVATLNLDGSKVAELHILRFYPVSTLNWIGLGFGTSSPAFVCGFDARRAEFTALTALFYP